MTAKQKLILLSLAFLALFFLRPADAAEPQISEDGRRLLMESSEMSGAGRHEDAAAGIEKFLQAGGSPHSAIWFHLGRERHLLAQWAKAEEAYIKALTLHPGLTAAGRNLGLVLYEQGKYREAVGRLSASVDSLKPEAGDILAIGVCHLRLELYASAASAFGLGVSLYPEDLALRQGLTQSLFSLRRYKEAADLVRESIRLKPASPELWQALAAALSATGDEPGAIDALEALLLLRPEDRASRSRLGDLYLSRNMPDEALANYLALTALDKTPAPLERIARCQLLLGRHKECRETLEKIPAESADAELRLLLAEACYRSGEQEEALRILDALGKERTAGGRVAYLAGLCGLELGRLAEAEQAFHKAASFALYRAPAMKQLVRVASMKGDKEAAREILKKAAREIPEDPWFRKALKDLQ